MPLGLVTDEKLQHEDESKNIPFRKSSACLLPAFSSAFPSALASALKYIFAKYSTMGSAWPEK